MQYYVVSSELMHYGVPGMRWGQRRAIKKAIKYEKKMLKYQGEADYQRARAKQKLEAKMRSANRATSKVNINGKIGEKISEGVNTAKLRRQDQKAYKRTLSAVNAAQSRGAKAAKAQLKADKYKQKLDKVKEKAKLDIGSETVAQYLLRYSS